MADLYDVNGVPDQATLLALMRASGLSVGDGAQIAYWRRFAQLVYSAAKQDQQPPGLTFTLREAEQLVGTFGGEDSEVTVRALKAGAVHSDELTVDESSPAGLWAHFTEYPEEGCLYLGPGEVDDDASPVARQAGCRARRDAGSVVAVRESFARVLSHAVRWFG